MDTLKCRKDKLVDLQADVFKKGSDGPRVDEEFRKICSAIDAATNLLEEIEVLNMAVLRSHNSKIVDIKIDGSPYHLQEKLQEVFNLQKAPKRGFIYISWRQSPADFYYVGLAKDVYRFNLMFPKKLTTTVSEATWLSLLFPTCDDWMTESIENSLLTLIQHHMGRLPKLNTMEVIENLLERVEIYSSTPTS